MCEKFVELKKELIELMLNTDDTGALNTMALQLDFITNFIKNKIKKNNTIHIELEEQKYRADNPLGRSVLNNSLIEDGLESMFLGC